MIRDRIIVSVVAVAALALALLATGRI